MRTYRGTLPDNGHTASTHTVTVDYGDGQGPRLLERKGQHSPTGFSWGYLGSGPATLACSILWDAFGVEPTRACYQAFKEEFVARWPQDRGWELSDLQLFQWMVRWLTDPDALRPRYLAVADQIRAESIERSTR